jgi:hypothetical protein
MHSKDWGFVRTESWWCRRNHGTKSVSDPIGNHQQDDDYEGADRPSDQVMLGADIRHSLAPRFGGSKNTVPSMEPTLLGY